MSSIGVNTMFNSEEDGKDRLEYSNCSEEQQENDDEIIGTEEELIDLVKKCPILYDVRLKVYKDRHLKESAWRSVAEAMKLSVPDCKGKWKNIRDAYVKFLNASRDDEGALAKKSRKRYKFADKMNFLDKCIQHRNPPATSPSAANYVKSKGSPLLNQNSLSMVVNYVDENRVAQLPNMEQQETTNSHNQHAAETSSPDKSFPGLGLSEIGRKRRLEIERNEDVSQAAVFDEQDDSKLFCLSLVSTLKRLSARKRQLAKLKIQNVLYEIEFSQDV